MNLGIIAEYNPFHNGHKYHIYQSKALSTADNVIVVMSGNFVQRGEPAIFDKYLRTKSALLNGADLVIELPVPYATGAADVFAYGSISLLNSSNIIDYLSFGSELGNLPNFISIAKLLVNEPSSFKDLLKSYLDNCNGLSYPVAREKALSEFLNKDCSFLKNPNNILSLEYLKFLFFLNSDIKPLTIKRQANDFHSTSLSGKFASATALRHSLFSDKSFNNIASFIPENSFSMLSSTLGGAISNLPSLDFYINIFNYILNTKSSDYLSQILDVTEGLENRMTANSNCSSVSEFLDKINTKRYTLSKLRRCVLHTILDIKKTDVNLFNPLPYIRVLGFRKEKSSLLSSLVANSSVPVITNLKKSENNLSQDGLSLLNKEIICDNIYYLSTTKEKNKDYTQPLIII